MRAKASMERFWEWSKGLESWSSLGWLSSGAKEKPSGLVPSPVRDNLSFHWDCLGTTFQKFETKSQIVPKFATKVANQKKELT